VDDEIMQVIHSQESRIGSDYISTFSVLRAALGSFPDDHLSGAPVSIYNNSNASKITAKGYVKAKGITNVIHDDISFIVYNGFSLGEDDASSPFKITFPYHAYEVPDVKYSAFDLVFPKMKLNGNVKRLYLRGDFQYVNLPLDAVYTVLNVFTGGENAPPGMLGDIWTGVGKHSQDFFVTGASSAVPLVKKKTLLDYNNFTSRIALTRFNNIDGYQSRDSFILKDSTGEGTYIPLAITQLSDLDSIRVGLHLMYNGDAAYDLILKMRGVGLFFDIEIDPLKENLYSSVKGRKSLIYLGDEGTGDLLENPISILYDILWQEIGLASFDGTSFVSAVGNRKDYKLAFALYDAPKLFKDVAGEICSTAGALLKENTEGKLSVTLLDIPSSTSGLTDIDDGDLVVDSDKVIDYTQSFTSIDNLVTEIIARYRPRYVDDTFITTHAASDVGGLSDYQTNASNILDFIKEAVVDIPYVRDQVTVENILSLLTQYRSDVFRVITVKGGLMLHSIDIGDFITYSGSQIAGTTGKVYLVTEVSLQPPCKDTEPYVKLTLAEFDVSGGNVIREAPNSSSEGWQETYTATDEYTEVPDA
jgi:hypothetical protein